LLDLLADARQVLFTATPFRRDEKEIKGKFVFTYDLRRAFQDRVFGDIMFQPVARGTAASIDIAIATATEAKFRSDRAAGLAHLVMVRADDLVVHRGNEDITITEYLNEETPSFYCSDLSAIEGQSLYPVPGNLEPFNNELFETVDWQGAEVDISREKLPGRMEGRFLTGYRNASWRRTQL